MAPPTMASARGAAAALMTAAVVAAGCSVAGDVDDASRNPLQVASTTVAPPFTTTSAPASTTAVDLPAPTPFDLAPATTVAPPPETTAVGGGSTPESDEPTATTGAPVADESPSVLDRLPDLTGEVIRILGPEVGSDAVSFEAGFAPFEAATGADIVYEGTQEDTTVLAADLEGGTPPDLAVIAQPGRLLDLASAAQALPVPQSIVDTVTVDFDPFWADLVSRGDRTYGVPNRASVKSLVWYSPARFAAKGYAIPQTWAELSELQTMMRTNGDTPWCIGISSGDATGWVFTDWVEDVMLRLHGPDVYDDWVDHTIGFDDERVVEAVEFVSDIWFDDGNVLGGRASVARTGFAAAGLPVLDGDCMLHRQASFYAGAYTAAGATIGADGDVDAFYLPTISDDFGTVVLGAGNYLAPFTDRTATYAALAFFASTDYADARIASGLGGFVSPNLRSDTAAYPTEIERRVADILLTADPFRFDASDLMPAAVGSAEFWRAGTAYVTGAITAQDLVDRIEANWPR